MFVRERTMHTMDSAWLASLHHNREGLLLTKSIIHHWFFSFIIGSVSECRICVPVHR